MPDIVRALVGRKELQGGGQQVAHVVERARTRRAEERLQFREGQFDRIEVRTIGREKSQERTGLLNRGAHLRLFMGGEIVEHDDIARPQHGHQDLLDIGAERVLVDRTIEHGRRGQLCGAERSDHGVRFPVAARRVIPDARAAKTPGVAAQQIRGHARFINEDVLARIAEGQRLAPLPPAGCDIRATLFVGVYGFFLRSAPTDPVPATAC